MWNAYRRACSEVSWTATATYLEQRLLKAARWVLSRSAKQVDFLHACKVTDPYQRTPTRPEVGVLIACPYRHSFPGSRQPRR